MAYQPNIGGYAGRKIQDVPLYGRKDPVGGGVSRMIQQAQRSRQSLARAQWEREQWQRKQYMEERAWNRSRQKKADLAERNRGRGDPNYGQRKRNRTSTKQDEYMKAYRMADALVGPGTPGGVGQMDPNIIARLTGMIGAKSSMNRITDKSLMHEH